MVQAVVVSGHVVYYNISLPSLLIISNALLSCMELLPLHLLKEFRLFSNRSVGETSGTGCMCHTIRRGLKFLNFDGP